MNYEYNHLRIIEKSPSGKLANFISIKHRGDVFPGQYFVAWAPGIGQASLPVSAYNDSVVELLLTKNNSVHKRLFSLKNKDVILLNGPFGHGFPMNNLKQKDVVMVGETSLFSPLWFTYNHIIQEKENYKKVSLLVLQTKPKKAFLQRLNDLKEKKEDVLITEDENGLINNLKNKRATKNTVFLLSLSSGRLKEAVKQLVNKGTAKNQIYFYLHRKISCGQGLCGTCMAAGRHLCIEGPVFRADQIWEIIDDE